MGYPYNTLYISTYFHYLVIKDQPRDSDLTAIYADLMAIYGNLLYSTKSTKSY